MKKALLIVALCGIIVNPVLGQSRKKPKEPKKDEPTGLNDKALGDAAFMQLKAAVESGGYEDLRKQLIAATLGRLSCGHLEDLDGLKGMVFVLRACICLKAIETLKNGEDLAKWLVEHPRVARRLFRAMQDYHRPGKALLNMAKLIEADEKAVQDYPDLAAAFATSNPLPKQIGEQPNPCTMVEAFKYYTDGKMRFRCNLKTLPFELARNLADSRLSIAERKWAVKRFGKRRDLLKVYETVPVDKAALEKGAPKKLASMPYTLPNIFKVGGDGGDSAYFTAEVSKALGQPATVVISEFTGGGGAAWPVVLVPAKGQKKPYWNNYLGKAKGLASCVSVVYNPAGGKGILASEFYLAGEAATLSLERREDAYVAVSLSTLVEHAIQTSITPDTDILKKLAELYNASVKDVEGKSPIDLEQFKSEMDCDGEMMAKLLDIAIERNLAYPRAWTMLTVFAQAEWFEQERLGKFVDILIKRVAKVYPDYSCLMVQRIAATIEEIPTRIKLYKQAASAFKNRPDLQGLMMIGLGDGYLAEDKRGKALKAYQQTAFKCTKYASICLDAADKAEDILVDANRPSHAINMYKKLFSKTRKYKKDSAFKQTSAFYQIGLRLVNLYEDIGKSKEARRIRMQIEA